MGSSVGAMIVIASFWLCAVPPQSASGPSQWYVGYGRMAVTQELAAVCAGILNSMDCARAIESYQQPRCSGRFRRSGETLRIPIESGKPVFLRDQWGDGAAGRAFSYIEFIPEIKQHLVHVQYYEGGCFWLVDAKSGNKTEICGVPILAPRRSRFACYQANWETGNSVEIWRIRGSGFDREWAFEPTDWAPAELVWLSEHSIRVSKEDFEGRELSGAIATRNGGVWAWTDQPDGRPKADR